MYTAKIIMQIKIIWPTENTLGKIDPVCSPWVYQNYDKKYEWGFQISRINIKYIKSIYIIIQLLSSHIGVLKEGK